MYSLSFDTLLSYKIKWVHILGLLFALPCIARWDRNNFFDTDYANLTDGQLCRQGHNSCQPSWPRTTSHSVSEGLPASPWHECPQQGLGRPWRQQPVCRTSPQPSLSELCITAWHNKFKSININYVKPNGMGTNTLHESGAERTTDTSQFVPVALFSCKLIIIRHTVAYNIQNRATETRNSSVFFHYETIFTLGCFFLLLLFIYMSILEAIFFHLPFLFSVKSEVNWTTREKKRNIFYPFTLFYCNTSKTTYSTNSKTALLKIVLLNIIILLIIL